MSSVVGQWGWTFFMLGSAVALLIGFGLWVKDRL